MPLLRVVTVAWLVGVLVALAADGSGGGGVFALRVVAAMVGVAGLLILRLGAPRFGLALFVASVGAATASPRPPATPALFDAAPWTVIARVDGSPRGANHAAPVALERAGPSWPSAEVRARVRLPLDAAPFVVGPGDRLLFRARFALPGRRCNPGACDSAWRAAADGIEGSALPIDAGAIEREATSPSGVAAWLWALRRAMARQIEAALPVEQAALVAALVVGERAAVGDEEEAHFRAAGVTHLLSVSGLHLAFAAGLLFAAARRGSRLWPRLGLRRPRDRAAALFALPAVAAYAVLTGAEVATVRAALVVSFAFAGVLVARRVRGLDALCFAALGLTLTRPASVVDPSFQLSFAAALATILVGRPPWRPPTRVARVGVALAGIVLASFAATVATAPFTALHFSQIAPMGVLTNVVAVPLTEAAIVPTGLVGALVALAGGGRFVLHVAGFLASLLLAFVDAVAAHAPIVTVAAPSKLVLLVSCAGMLWAALSSRRRLQRLALVAGVVLALVGAERLWAWARPAVEVVFLDVGQGDAAVAFLPGGEVIVDRRRPRPTRAGARAVPAAARRAAGRSRWCSATSTPTTREAWRSSSRQFPVGELWTNGRESEIQPCARCSLKRPDVTFGSARRGSRRWGEVTLGVLAPRDAAGAVAADPLDAENDNSLVLRLRYGGRSLLFAGDIEAAAEAALVARAARRRRRRAQGAAPRLATSSSEELLAATRPRWAVVSLADGNRYRFPHPDVVARYREHGVALLRTDRDGAVSVRVSRGGAVGVRCARPVAAPTGKEGLCYSMRLVPIRLKVTSDGDPSRAPYRYEFDGDRAQIVLGRRGGVDVLLPHAEGLAGARAHRAPRGALLPRRRGLDQRHPLNGDAVAGGTRAALREGDRIAIGEFAWQCARLAHRAEARARTRGSIARRMVRDVLERLGPGEAQPCMRVLEARRPASMLTLADVGRTYILGSAPRARPRARRRGHVARARGARARRERRHLAPARAGHGLRVDGEGRGAARSSATATAVTLGATSVRYLDPAEAYLRRLEVAAERPSPRVARGRRGRRARRSWLLVARRRARRRSAALGGIL